MSGWTPRSVQRIYFGFAAALKRRRTLITLDKPMFCLTDLDQHLFSEGMYYRAYEKLGAHPQVVHGQAGTSFTVWAPNAAAVSVVGDFNGWRPETHPLSACGSSGLWEGFIASVGPGGVY